MTNTLKSCPFCGGTANIAKGQIEFWVYCPHCGAQMEPYETEQEAVKAWNTRTTDGDKVKYEPTSYSCRACKNATDKEIKCLREALKKAKYYLEKVDCYILPISDEADYFAKVRINEILKGDKEWIFKVFWPLPLWVLRVAVS